MAKNLPVSQINSLILNQDLTEIISADLPFQNLSKKTILVSGANGFLPAYLVDTFLHLNKTFNLGITVLGLVRNVDKARQRFSHHVDNNSLQFIVQDVITKLPSTTPAAQIVIHAASQATPAVFQTDPVGTLKANSLGTLNLLDWSREVGAESFLNFSSGEVYGQVPDSQIPIQEKTFGYLDSATVRSCYAESKRFAETACVSYFGQYGLQTKTVRPFHTYGPGMSLTDGRVFSDFVANIISNKNIVLKSDGSVRRPFCYLTDATVGFLTVLLKGQPGEAYNVGNPKEEVSILELAEKLVGLFPEKGLKVERMARSDKDPYMQSPILRNSPDIKKLNALGWSPKHTIESGFKRTVESFNVY